MSHTDGRYRFEEIAPICLNFDSLALGFYPDAGFLALMNNSSCDNVLQLTFSSLLN